MSITREQSDQIAEKVVAAIDQLEAEMPVDIRHEEQMRQYRECVSKVLFEALNTAAACLLAIVLFVGCSSPSANTTDYQPLAAAVIATSGTAPSPTPVNPNPPSGTCTNCNGTGKLGDGTVFVPCPVCGGDGKITQADIDDRELKISTFKAFAERHLRERDEARQERDEALDNVERQKSIILAYAAKEQAAKAAKSRPVATSSGCASRQTNARAYTVKRVGPFGRAVYVPAR